MMELTEEEQIRYNKIKKEITDKLNFKLYLIEKIGILRSNGLSYGEIGKTLNMPKSTIYKYHNLKNGN